MMTIMISARSKLLLTMKKMISNAMLFAAAAMAFFSCQKQESVDLETSGEVVLSFVSEKPSLIDETRTEWTGETIRWSAGDRISIAYTVDGNWQNASGDASGDARLYKSETLAEACETAQFNVSASFKGTTEGTHVFYGVYPAPSPTDFFNAPEATLTIPAIQTPGAASFDGAADLMTAVSEEYAAIPEDKNVSLLWTRLVAHADLTLKALNGVTAGETVSSIKLTAQEGANLVGSQKVNLITNEVTCNNDEANVVDLMGGNLSIDEDGNIEFWACILPTTLTSLKVEVETNKASYTREISGIEKTFKQNARNTLSIKMNEATRVAKEEESWVLVKPADGLTEGTYVLVISTDTKTGALVSTNGSSSAPTFNTSVSVSDNTLNGVTEAMQFDLSGTAGNYKLAVTGQTTNYLYTTSTNNGVRVGTNANNVWTITEHESNADAFVFKCNATNRYLGVYNNQDWRCYDQLSKYTLKGASEIYLYKKQSGPVVPDTTPSITVAETLELTSAEAEGTISVTYKNLEELEAAAYSDEECTTECDWLIASWENGAVSYLAEANEGDERTAYIQIYALDAESNEYSKIITVTQDAYVDPSIVEKKTIAEFRALADGDTVYELEGRISEIATAYSDQYDNISFYIVDETTGDSIQIFRMSCEGVTDPAASISVGDRIIVRGAKDTYGGQPQMTAGGVYVSHEDGAATPKIVCANNAVTITADAGAVIYYTTDGQTPTASSAPYVGEFPITETKTVKAIAIETGKLTSLVASEMCEYLDPSAPQLVIVTMSVTGTTGTLASDNSYISWTEDGFTCTNEKTSSSSAIRTNDSDHYRVYAKSVLKFTASEKTISKVVVTCMSPYADVLKTSAENAGYTAAVDGNDVTITSASPVSEMSMTASTQIRISKVVATLN